MGLPEPNANDVENSPPNDHGGAMDGGSEESSASSSRSEYEGVERRANRFDGPPSTWKHLTEEDRAVHGSLVRQRDEDLAVHLYNAHALKRRVRDAKDKEEPRDTFVPPKVWTAWPLPPEIVPREDEVVGEEDGLEGYTLKKGGRWRPSRGLEDVLVGTTLRIAKDRLGGREWALSDDGEDTNVEEDGPQEGRDGGDDDDDDAQNAREAALKPVISADDDRSRELLRPTIRHNLSRLDDLLLALHHSRRACLRAMSSDSDAQTDITGSQMTNRDQSDDESIPATPSKKQKFVKRGPGRPRKYESMADLPRKEIIVESPSPAKGSPSKRGRPKKEYPRLVDESDYEYAVRIARIRKQPLPPPPESLSQSLATEAKSPSPTVRSTPNRNSPRKRRNSEGELKVEARWNPRDWSEVLGAAAIIGFPEDVIARATQRCADLFGEGMKMRTLGYGLPPSGKLVTYLPDMVPTIEIDSFGGDENNEHSVRLSGADNMEEGDQGSEGELVKDGNGKKQRRPRSKVIDEKYWCPIDSCLRNKHGFGKGNHLRRHLVGQHGYEEGSVELKKAVRENKALGNTGDGRKRSISAASEGDGEELGGDISELEGGVHVDGFLRVVKGGRKGRGKDVGGRKVGIRKGRGDKGKGKSKSTRTDDEEGEENNLPYDIGGSDLDLQTDDENEGGDLNDTQEEEAERTRRRRTRSAKEAGDRERRELVERYGVGDEGSGSDFEMGEGGGGSEDVDD